MHTEVTPKRPKVGTEGAGDQTGYAPQTLRNLRCIGGGPPYYKHGNKVVYDPDELDEWMAERRRLSTSQPAPQAA